jgi:hypothetical protein
MLRAITKDTLFYGDDLSILRDYVADLLNGAAVTMPATGVTFRQARREAGDGGAQPGRLGL